MRSSKKASDASLENGADQKKSVTAEKKLSQRYIVANWKMNKTIREASEYIKELVPLLPQYKKELHVWLSVPFTTFQAVQECLSGSSILFGAQNMNDASPGSFTGEIASSMLKEAGCSFVILGHSERRRYFHETDELIQKKVRRAIDSGLTPILCIGETYDEREAGHTESILEKQIRIATEGLTPKDISKLIIAYEPVWAIGTGKSATPDIVEKAHECITKMCSSLLQDGDQRLPILYGGSVTHESAKELIDIPNVDGFLVGTASLQPNSFAKIIEACL